jgi:hypothetical protein
LCSHSRTSQHLMEPVGSISCSKEPPTGPILSHINPIHIITFYLSKIDFNVVHPPTSWSSQWSPSFWLSHQNIVYALLLSPIRATCPAHLILLDLIIIQFSPTSSYLKPPCSKYSPQHPVLKFPQSMLLP